MDDRETPKFGTSEGTHAAENSAQAVPDPARAAKIGATTATVEAAIGDLVAGLGGAVDDGQSSLMLDEMDEQMALFSGPVRHVADTMAAARGRGRPRGSQNKNAFRDVLMRMGFRHPGLNLAAMANADPAALAVELGALPEVPDGMAAHEWLSLMVRTEQLKRGQVVALMSKAHDLIGRANAELMPYFESKRPTEIVATSTETLGVMIIGEMPVAKGRDDGVIDVTAVDMTNE